MHAPTQEYRTALESVVATLRGIADDVSIRGNHAGQFVFATADGRAIELSQSDDGVWVEFWDTDADSPDHESTYDSYESAVDDVSQWLAPAST